MVTGVCCHHCLLSSSVICNTRMQRHSTGTVHGGPVVLRLIRATPCFYCIVFYVILFCSGPISSIVSGAIQIQLTSLRLYESLLIARTALHARCVIVVPSVTMHVQNYAGSAIKRGSC